MIDRPEIIRIARTWKGVPYKHQGRTRRGVDCVGVLIAVGAELGIEMGDPVANKRYGRNPEGFWLQPEMDKHLTLIDRETIQPGDVLLLRIDIVPQHVAIVTDYWHLGPYLAMLHCHQRVGRVVEHRLADVWRAKIVRAYQIPGTEAIWQH